MPFSLTLGEVTIPDRCPVLGIPLVQKRGRQGPGPNSPTLDRIIPELGYVPGNVVVISNRANRLKSDATIGELIALASFYGGLRVGRERLAP